MTSWQDLTSAWISEFHCFGLITSIVHLLVHLFLPGCRSRNTILNLYSHWWPLWVLLPDPCEMMVFQFSFAMLTNYHQRRGLEQYTFIISPFPMFHESGMAWLGSLFRISHGWNPGVCWGRYILQSWAFSSKLIQVIGRKQFLMVAGLKSLFFVGCWPGATHSLPHSPRHPQWRTSCVWSPRVLWISDLSLCHRPLKNSAFKNSMWLGQNNSNNLF